MRAGDPAAKPALESMLYEDAGRGVVQFAELQEAAELGPPGAMSQLGQVYLRGEGIPGDPVRGRIWLERAIEAGNLPAATTLGPPYPEGRYGLERDPAEDRPLLHLAVAAGDPNPARDP